MGWDPERGGDLSGPEFERLLGGAEHLLTRVDAARERLRWYEALRAVVLAVLVLVGLVAAVSASDWWTGAGVAAGATVVVAWFAGTFRRSVVKPLLSQIYRDEKLMVATVNMLRELLPLLSHDERWSEVRQDRSRLRLGRFPIEPRGL
ncbi:MULTISPECIES: hypothetical protein [Micromonospora]|uniref:SMODS and SLOG-associating 2TM effector domain-containing protein n=1 Tax=Micromonospora marina TaxID=307120 RepID=A0A1C4W9F9_9ACTN|nr:MULTISPECIES: hypothetical protein [Micromonospora]ADL46901.1 hypothetical protein Micau_3373 [Micromonospora aurantiaca ATCC 27029]OHX02105.1 hypothetical protein BFV98_03435 [Micromonospora sp. WMMB235]SCE92830.1 hypothetical protein GA0070215_104328 [Micromonospora marina]